MCSVMKKGGVVGGARGEEQGALRQSAWECPALEVTTAGNRRWRRRRQAGWPADWHAACGRSSTCLHVDESLLDLQQPHHTPAT